LLALVATLLDAGAFSRFDSPNNRPH
jgi:hypothetical protein